MTTQTQVSNLKINKLTKAQYNTITPSETELYFITDEQEASLYSETNPALTSTDSICTWNVVHSLGDNVNVSIYDASTNKEVVAEVTLTNSTTAKVELFSTSNISAGAYKAVVVGA